MHILAVFQPLDPVTGDRVTVRASSAQLRAITGLGGQRWWPALVTKPALTMKLFDGDFSSPVEPGTASVTLNVAQLARAVPNVRRFVWQGAKVTFYAGEETTSWPWPDVFTGVVSSFSATGSKLDLQAEVDSSPFDADVLIDTYEGTTGLEGGADLKGVLKPLVIGSARFVEPVLIDTVDSVFQISAYGPIRGVSALYERGAQFAAAVADFADYDELVTADIPHGRWGTCLAEGLIRLGAPPAGVITVDVEGDYPDEASVRKPGEVIARMAAIAGVSSSLLNEDSLAELDDFAESLPSGGNINLVLREQESVLSIAQRIARSCNFQAGVDFQGKLFVTRPAFTSPSLTLDAQGRRKPAVVRASEASVSPPYRRIQMSGARCWRPLGLEEIAFAARLTMRGLYDEETVYREGDIVSLGNGSQWLFVGEIPAVGSAPGAGNDDWQAMTPGFAGFTHFAYADSEDGEDNFTTGAPGGRSYQGISANFPSAEPSEDPADYVWGLYRGPSGYNSAPVVIYKRSGTTPSVPSVEATYSFATGVLSGHNNDWSQSPPAGDTPLYVTNAIARSQSATAVIESADWATPRILVEPPPGPTPSLEVSRKAVSLWAYANGNVVSFDDAQGILKVRQGASDITSLATLAASASSGVTGTINTAANDPVSGQPKGYYRVTAMTGRTGMLTLTATIGDLTLTEIFSISKSIGGYEIVEELPEEDLFDGRMVFLESDGKLYRYMTGTGWTSSVPAIDIEGQLQSGQIGENQITIGKLAIIPESLIPDPYFRDPSYWAGAVDEDGWFQEEAASGNAHEIMGVPSGLAIGPEVSERKHVRSVKLPFSGAGQVLRLRARGLNNSGDSVFVSVEFFDQNDEYLDAVVLGWADGISVPENRSDQKAVPEGTNYIQLAIYNAGDIETDGWAAISAVKLDVASSAELIVDGAVRGRHVAADEIDTNHLRAGAVTAAKVAVSELSAISADLGTVTAGIVQSPTGNAKFDLNNAQIVFNNGSFMKVTGVGFGSSNQFLEWYGPTQSSPSACTEANARYYLKTNGDAYFGGALAAGVIHSAQQTTSIASDALVELGQFSTNGNPKSVVVSYNYAKVQVIGGVPSSGMPSNSATITIERSVNWGSWEYIGTLNATGTTWIVAPTEFEFGYVVRPISGSITITDYTSATSNIRFRARLTSRSLGSGPSGISVVYDDGETQNISISSTEQ
jgi:hypothetical protein